MSFASLLFFAAVVAGETACPVPDGAVLEVLSALQRAAKSGKAAAFVELLSPQVTVARWVEGRTVTAAKGARELTDLLLDKKNEGANPFRSPTALAANVVSATRTESGWALRVKYRWRVKIAGALGGAVSRGLAWQMGVIELGAVSGVLRVTALNLLPEDVHRRVIETWLAFVREKEPADEVAALGELNRLTLAFAGTGVATVVPPLKWLRFFEGRGQSQDLLRRKAEEANLIEVTGQELPKFWRFPQRTTRFVFAQLVFKNPLYEVGEYVLPITTRYVNALSGHELAAIRNTLTFKADWPLLMHLESYGAVRPGLWQPGTYRVEVVINGKEVGRGTFYVYDDSPLEEPEPDPVMVVAVPALGLEVESLSRKVAARYNLTAVTGARIAGIVYDGPAARAQMNVNEAIVFVDHVLIRSAAQLERHVRRVREGTTVRMTVVQQNGLHRTYLVRVGRTPPAPRRPDPREVGKIAALGVTVADLNRRERRRLRLPPTSEGVLVRTVAARGPAARAGFRTDDVIVGLGTRTIENDTELRRYLDRLPAGVMTDVFVLRNGKLRVRCRVKLGPVVQ